MKPAVLEISYPVRKGIGKNKLLLETKNSTVHVKKKSWFIKNWTKFTTDPLPLTPPSLQLKHSYINIPVIVKYFTVTYRRTSSATAVLGTSQSLTGLWYLWQEVRLWHQRYILLLTYKLKTVSNIKSLLKFDVKTTFPVSHTHLNV